MTSVGVVLASIEPWSAIADGFTVSGGEPFEQPEALAALLTELRPRTSSDILVFSGFPFEVIADHVQRMTGLIDALITDPFRITAPQTLALRGSDNQRLHVLTPLGQQRYLTYERAATDHDRRLDVMMDEDGSVWLAGIPARGDFDRLRSALADQGHLVSTSEDRSLSKVPVRHGPRR